MNTSRRTHELSFDAMIDERIVAILDSRYANHASSHIEQFNDAMKSDIDKRIASRVERIFPRMDKYIHREHSRIRDEINAENQVNKYQQEIRLDALYDSVTQTMRGVSKIEDHVKYMMTQQDDEHNAIYKGLNTKFDLQRIEIDRLHKKVEYLSNQMAKDGTTKKTPVSGCEPRQKKKEILLDTVEVSQHWTTEDIEDANMRGATETAKATETATATDFSGYIRQYERKYSTSLKYYNEIDEDILEFIDHLKCTCYNMANKGDLTLNEWTAVIEALERINSEYIKYRLQQINTDKTLRDTIERRLVELVNKVGIKFLACVKKIHSVDL